MQPVTVVNPFAPGDVPDADLTVLLWNDHWFGDEYEAPLEVTMPCGSRVTLQFTRDHGRQWDADAIWMHAPTLRDLPEKRAGQPWVLVSMEADANYPFQASLESWTHFELRMTHQLDADVPTPYANRREYKGFQPGVRPLQQKTAPVCFIASNRVPARDDFVRKLMRHVPVDSYGACLNNRDFGDLVPPGTTREEEASTVIASYPFYLAFENCREWGYVTEKLYRPLSVGTIPIYWGAPNVRDFIPAPNAIVTVEDGQSPKELARLISAAAADPVKLAQHHAWQRESSPNFERLLDLGDLDPRARLATKLAHGCGRDCLCGGRQVQRTT